MRQEMKTGIRSPPGLRESIELLSMPLETRHTTLTACITSKWKEGDFDEPGRYGDADWQLSYTIPQPLLQVSHQIREEAFRALAAYPFAVVCNVCPSGEIEGWTADPEGFQLPERPTIQEVSSWDSGNHARVHKQMERLAPTTRRLHLCLYADDDHQIVEDLEACRWSFANNVLMVTAYWGNWQRVDIDPEGMHQAMQTQTNLEFYDVEGPLGPHLEKGWKAICEELEPLRKKASIFRFGLKGWDENHILKTLEKP